MSPPRHILFVTEFFHPDLCASAVVATDHLTKIAAARPDWRITVITSQRAWNSPHALYPLFEDWSGLKILRVRRPPVSRTSLLRRGWGFIEFGYQAVRAARAMPQVDLVIATTAPPQGGAIARRIAKHRSCPYIYEVLDLYPDCASALHRIKPGGMIERAWHRFDKKVMVEAIGVVTIANRITERLAETRGIPGDCLLTIHDGFDPMRLVPFERNEFKEKYNPDNRFVVQYAGNMGLSHPFESIVAAARLLLDDQSILMMFIGEGPQRAVIRAGLAADGLALDYQPPETLSQLLATADVCLISQHADMFDKALPYKIYAILAAGRPSIFIGDARSEIAQWLTQNGAGVHIDQGKPEALVALIRELKDNPQRRDAMSRAARALFEQQFNSTRAAQAWIETIDGVLPQP